MKFPYLINRIGFAGGEGGNINPGSIAHNQLSGKQGGDLEKNEYFHISQQSYIDLTFLICNVPSNKVLWVNPISDITSFVLKGQIIKPYKTIQFALRDAVDGDLIVLFPGNYDEINLTLKNGVNIFFMEGATCIPTNQHAPIFIDNSGPVTCSITGRGIIRNKGTGGNDTNAIVIGQNGSRLFVDLLEVSSVECWDKNAVIEFSNTTFTFEVALYNGGSAIFKNCFFNECVQYFDLSRGNSVKLYNCRLKNTLPAPAGTASGAFNLFGIVNAFHYHDGRNSNLIPPNIFPYLLFKDCSFYSSGHNIVLAHRRAIGSNSRTTCVFDNCRFFSTDNTKNAIHHKDLVGNIGEVIPVDFKLISSLGNTDLGGGVPIINQISGPGYTKEISIENYVL